MKNLIHAVAMLLLMTIAIPVKADQIAKENTAEFCEKENGSQCVYRMCDYIPPDKTYEETCGKVSKGWVPLKIDKATQHYATRSLCEDHNKKSCAYAVDRDHNGESAVQKWYPVIYPNETAQ